MHPVEAVNNHEDRVDRDAWLAHLRASGRLSTDEIAELSDHLEEAVSRAKRAGVPPDQAFQLASEALGNFAHLIPEFERNRTMERSLSARLAALAIATLPIAAAGCTVGLSPLLHLPSFLLVVGMVITGLIASFGPRVVLDALRATSGGAQPLDASTARTVFQRGYQLSWAAGVLGVLFGVVTVLANLSDPAQIGPGLAIAILSMLYGAMLAEIGFRNLEHWIPVPVQA